MISPRPTGCCARLARRCSLPDQSLSVTDDYLLGQRVRLRQPASGYRVAIDPVLLAASVEAKTGARVLDLGAGVGAAGLCLLARLPGIEVTAWEIDPGLAELGRQNAALNNVAENFHMVERDAFARGADGSFDQVITNPPYHGAAETDAAPDAVKARATVEVDLEGWIRAAAGVLKHKGVLTIMFRADRLDRLLASLSPGFGGIVVFPLWPKSGTPAKRILVRAIKGSRAPLALANGLVLHEGNGYTDAATTVLRDARALPL